MVVFELQNEHIMTIGTKAYSPEDLRRMVLSEKRVKSGLRAEELREQMDPKALMSSMLSLVHEADSTAIEELPRLKFKADIYSTLLKKCMPDLRSLEIKESDSAKSTLIIEMGASQTDQTDQP